jgi:hypothetical protein
VQCDDPHARSCQVDRQSNRHLFAARDRQLAVAWEYCRCWRVVEGDVYERMEAGGLSVDEPVSDLQARQFHIIFRRFDSVVLPGGATSISA